MRDEHPKNESLPVVKKKEEKTKPGHKQVQRATPPAEGDCAPWRLGVLLAAGALGKGRDGSFRQTRPGSPPCLLCPGHGCLSNDTLALTPVGMRKANFKPGKFSVKIKKQSDSLPTPPDPGRPPAWRSEDSGLQEFHQPLCRATGNNTVPLDSI